MHVSMRMYTRGTCMHVEVRHQMTCVLVLRSHRFEAGSLGLLLWAQLSGALCLPPALLGSTGLTDVCAAPSFLPAHGT